jgi:heme-degrading monooxygenase HmoA
MINAVGRPPAVYDAVMADVAEPRRRAPGFTSHTAHVENAGITVTEVWETREQWRAWFDTSLPPHLPAHAADPAVIDLHHARSSARASEQNSLSDQRSHSVRTRPASPAMKASDASSPRLRRAMLQK